MYIHAAWFRHVVAGVQTNNDITIEVFSMSSKSASIIKLVSWNLMSIDSISKIGNDI